MSATELARKMDVPTNRATQISINTLATLKRSEPVRAQVLALLPETEQHTPMLSIDRASKP
jgi:hypothetical protein